ncbi:ribonuclease H-like domain-containing protein [Baffinella frigidus]|nr:ribonuclease H-like domain-containing protein [Cryptophyta sp. CCMP2293]
MVDKGQADDAWEYASTSPHLQSLLSLRGLAPPTNPYGPVWGGREEVGEVLSLSADIRIVWVADVAGVEMCRKALEAAGEVGIDSEWRHPRPSSLLQIATLEEVFLIDVALADAQACVQGGFASAVENLVNWLLCDFPGTALGFSFASDASRLTSLFSSIDPDAIRVTDCQPLGAALPGGNGNRGHGEGLYSCCRQLLGKGLDKAQQCSNWDRRPLLDTQVSVLTQTQNTEH